MKKDAGNEKVSTAAAICYIFLACLMLAGFFYAVRLMVRGEYLGALLVGLAIFYSGVMSKNAIDGLNKN